MRNTRRNNRDTPTATEQALLDNRFEHRLQLARRTRQQDNQFCFVFDPEAWSGSVLVRQHGRARRHHCLAAVDRGRHEPAGRESLFDRFEDLRVILERPTDKIRDNVTCEIVVGRAEPPRQNEQVAPAQRIRDDRLQDAAVVAGNSFPLQVDPDLVETLGDEQRIRIDVSRRQHLAADGNDFCSHADWGALPSCRVMIAIPARNSTRRAAEDSRRSPPSRRQP